jgi:small subunit ribosomal protein S17
MSHDRRKIRTGKVVSNSMDKTIVVSVEWRQPHRIYKKNVRKWSRFKVHDETNQCSLGDVVRIIETRPLSKTKNWKVQEVIQKGDLADIQPHEINDNSMGENDSNQMEGVS